MTAGQTYNFEPGKPSLTLLDVVTIHHDGRIEIRDGKSPDEAAVAFWECVRKALPIGWQPIETAPRDGRLLLSYWGKEPVFVYWGRVRETVERKVKRRWGFGHRIETDARTSEPAWRVAIWSPRLGWGPNGNCGDFTPPAWQPIPPPPERTP
jgi:hypothetical protein